jgi:threonine efflux protein
MTGPDLLLILGAALIAGGSPGPATLAISGTAMTQGRAAGLALASGVTSGSFIWSIAAALGLSALMVSNAWAVEVMRYVGAGYLGWLAIKSAKSAWKGGAAKTVEINTHGRLGRAYAKGLALHLTNPKAILFFGSLYAIGIPPGSTPTDLMIVIAAVGLQSAIVFHGYAVLFSTSGAMRAYARMKRGFEAAFAILFGAAALKILTARLA